MMERVKIVVKSICLDRSEEKILSIIPEVLCIDCVRSSGGGSNNNNLNIR